MATSALPRSYLFVPANRPERLPKARASGAHAIIVDLEDAVGPELKSAARAALSDALSPAQPVIVRINGVTTPWFDDDVRLCAQPGVAAVMLPKAQTLEELQGLANALPSHLCLLPLIETAVGLSKVLELARAPRVQRLAFGVVDFQADLGLIGAGAEELAPFRAQLVLASRIAGILTPVDGPTLSMEDEQAVRADAMRARRAGFGAKLCIHPRQIGWVNESFSPSAAEIAWAQRVQAAVQSSQGGVVSVDGKMVDRPVLMLAAQILGQVPLVF